MPGRNRAVLVMNSNEIQEKIKMKKLVITFLVVFFTLVNTNAQTIKAMTGTIVKNGFGTGMYQVQILKTN